MMQFKNSVSGLNPETSVDVNVLSSTAVSRFNVLDRNESVHRHLLLEASAGTGKTFAIENIVVRLLIENLENKPIQLENILVVTFTRMAARELKERIHANLEKSQLFLNAILAGKEIENCIPDYLLAQMEKGEEAIVEAKKSIERALFSFDRAQIFTIHGFCWRMLKNHSIEAEISLDAGSREDQSLSAGQLLQVVRDFLRNGLDSSLYSAQQLKIIMKRAKGDPLKLQNDLLSEIHKGMDIEAPLSFRDLFQQFKSRMASLKQRFNYSSEKIVSDFFMLAPSYKELCNRSGQVHQEKVDLINRFAVLFEKNEWMESDFDCLIEDGLFLLDAFDPSLLKTSAKDTIKILHYPTLLNDINEYLEPIVCEARHEVFLFSRLAHDCRKFVRRYQDQEEMFGHNELLIQMRKALDKPPFLNCVRANYQAAIVDEFQDTDPVQWEIFSLLFASSSYGEWPGHLNLVGDPKQSIYAFRQADIYTYLNAATKLGPGSLATLDTNYRSQSALIAALNDLFNSSSETFSLPKLSKSLDYRTVEAGRKEDSTLLDQGPLLQFLEITTTSTSKNPIKQAEISILYPAIAQEILNLHQSKDIGFGQFAILIADKHQSKRIANYLRDLNIPVKSYKGIDISTSLAVDELRDLLNGVVNFHSKSKLNIALASRLVGMNAIDLENLENEEHFLAILEQMSQLKKVFYELGFAAFYQKFMYSTWHLEGKSVLERLLNQIGGVEFYREWQDLADVVIAEEQSQRLLPQGLIAFLDRLSELSREEDDRIKAYVDPNEEGVSILTTHMSKGLEFEIVFALGLIKRTKALENGLIPLEFENKSILGAVKNKNDPRFLKYCEESDAEKMRQLYVALTRAREKLYILVIFEENPKELSYGCASPIELFIARLEQPVTDYKGLYQRIFSGDRSILERLALKFPDKIGLTKLNCEVDIQPFRKKALNLLLSPPKIVNIPKNECIIQSFTSLAHSKTSGPLVIENPGMVRNAPHDFCNHEKTEHTLPSGAKTGVLLHKIFEELPFGSVRELTAYESLRPLILPYLQGTVFSGWDHAIANMVFKAFKTNLKGANFCLADINPRRSYCETEFFYPCAPNHAMLQGVQAQSGYLKGVVDLFFEHMGKYYLLDWKSNWLGPSQECYGDANLNQAMLDNHYDLQAKIYCDAFERYLKIVDRRPFEEIFGGIYYVFVRGISDCTGILHYPKKGTGDLGC